MSLYVCSYSKFQIHPDTFQSQAVWIRAIPPANLLLECMFFEASFLLLIKSYHRSSKISRHLGSQPHHARQSQAFLYSWPSPCRLSNVELGPFKTYMFPVSLLNLVSAGCRENAHFLSVSDFDGLDDMMRNAKQSQQGRLCCQLQNQMSLLPDVNSMHWVFDSKGIFFAKLF